MDKSLRTAIKKTCDYAKRYGMRLSRDQLFDRLISRKIYKISAIDRMFFEHNQLNKNRPAVIEKIQKAYGLANFLKDWPEILFVAITGSVAAESAEGEDDIDLMIITKSDGLWTTRLKLWWWMRQHQVTTRKRGEKEQADEWCINLWLDEYSLKLPLNRQCLRNAVDMILMKPLVDKQAIYLRFLKSNQWAKKWVATGYQSRIRGRQIEFWKNNKTWWLTKLINRLAYLVQLCRMGKKDNEEVGPHKAYFYP